MRQRIRSQDLGLVPSDVALPDQFRLDLGRYWPHSGLRFALACPFAVERGNRGAAYRFRSAQMVVMAGQGDRRLITNQRSGRDAGGGED